MNLINKEQIENVIKQFYAQVSTDDLLGPIFNDVTEVNWDEHIEQIVKFWNSIMLGIHEYSGNPMMQHILLNQQVKLEITHFTRWLKLFREAALSSLSEENAKIMIQRAELIAKSIKYRLGLIHAV